MYRTFIAWIFFSLSQLSAIVVVPFGIDTIQIAILLNPLETEFELMVGPAGYELQSTVLIDRTLTIRGQAATGVEVFTTTDTLNTMFQINASNVIIENFQVSQELAAPAPFSIQQIFSIGSFFVGDFSGIIFDNIHAKYMQNVVSARESSFTIVNSFFDADHAFSESSHRAIRINGNRGLTTIENNTFNTVAGKRTYFMLSTSNPVSSGGSGTFEGTIYIKDNTQLTTTTPAWQFYIMESFNGAPRSLQLIGEGNTFKAEKGSFIFFSVHDLPADLFSLVDMINNTDLSDPVDDYKGLVAFDGYPEPQVPRWDVTLNAQNYFSFSGNTLTTTSITRPLWEPFLYAGGLFGINSEVYKHFIIGPPAVDPNSLFFRQFAERFVMQGDLINGLIWLNPEPGAVTAFNVYKNSPTNLIKTVRALPIWNRFFNHRQRPNVETTYYLQTVSATGTSTLTPITGPKK